MSNEKNKCRSLVTPALYQLAVLVAAMSMVATAHAGFEIERHQTGSVDNLDDLEPGADRGTITQPLLTGTIGGQEVLFVITDASDKDFAEMFGTVRADALEEAPDAAVETAIFDDETGAWTFFNDPGLVTRFNNGNVLPPVANPDYSPLKRFEWEGKLITVNVPFVKWGDGPGQQLIEDMGGCDPLIRSNPPSPFFVGDGPTNGADCSMEGPLDRYKGGQVVSPDAEPGEKLPDDARPGIDLTNMTVTMKLHKATFDHPDKIPYYTVFDASKGPPAGFMGVPHAPKTRFLGRFGDNDAVGRIAQFSNGVRNNAGGPNRFQQGITSYRGGQQGTYSPMWHITWIFFACAEKPRPHEFFDAQHNRGEGAPFHDDGHGFFPPPPGGDLLTFDPFQMFDKGVECLEFAASVTGNADGFIEDLGHLDDLIDDGDVLQTEGPAGLRLDSPSNVGVRQPPLIVNCPVPLTVRM